MEKELDDLLCRTFPNLYRDRNASAQETCMCWGFPGRGWFLIIWNLSAKLEQMILEMPDKDRASCRASQVKEKFGTLRFYMSCSTNQMSELIDAAEETSGHVCEDCGLPGELSKHNWYRTMCNLCTLARRERIPF